MKTFTIKEEHLKLLKRANIDWFDCEFGAPCIDPKRPYGNSYVYGDIAEILGIKSNDGEFSPRQEEEMARLHRDLETVLQIAVITGKFQVGTYAQTKDYDYRSWKKVK